MQKLHKPAKKNCATDLTVYGFGAEKTTLPSLSAAQPPTDATWTHLLLCLR